jgi:hypothetical protein
MATESSEEGFKVTDRRRRADEGEPRPEPAPRRPTEPPPSAQPPRELDPAHSLAGLFVMFASSALIALGESPDPLTGLVQKDLAQASEAIDVLTLLREKTEGNRTPQESELLEQILYDLQIRFVRATGQPSG